MKKSKDSQIIIERNYKVVKGNEIIQKAKFDLSTMEQKTFCYAVSKIKPTDVKDTEYTFTVNEYCDVCGINRNSGKTIEEVKAALKRLSDKSFYILDENGDWVLIRWLSKVKISPKSGRIKIKFDEDMQKYLIGLYDNYTQYSLICVLPMRSAYSIRLYELLKSYAGQGQKQKEFEIDDLKARLAAPYVNFKDFRVFALEKATREINEFTDIEISWEPVNKGRKVVSVLFHIAKRDSWGIARNEATAADVLDGQMRFDADGKLTEHKAEKRAGRKSGKRSEVDA